MAMNEMELIGVRIEMPSNAPIVLLRETGGVDRLLPIFIGGGRGPGHSVGHGRRLKHPDP